MYERTQVFPFPSLISVSVSLSDPFNFFILRSPKWVVSNVRETDEL